MNDASEEAAQRISEPSSQMIKIVIVEDHPAIREALQQTLKSKYDLVLAGEAETAKDAIELIGRTRPDVAVVDISLKEGHGLELVADIRRRFDGVEVVVFSMYDETAYAERAIRAGALGYVMKTAPTRHVIEAIRQAASGEVYLSRSMGSRMLTRMIKGDSHTGLRFAVDDFTDRELTVFQMLGEGVSLEQIAERLDLSHKTVEVYRRRAKEKLGLSNVSELLQHAVVWASGRKKD